MDRPASSQYRELPPPPALAPFLDCLWVRHTPPAGERGEPRILPDGCIDIVWVGDDEPHIAGPATRTEFPALPPDTPVAGARFKPGLAPTLLGLPSNELRDQRVPLRDVWAGQRVSCLTDGISAPSASARAARLAAGLIAILQEAAAPDPIVERSVALLRQDTNVRIGALSRELELSERQLRRRFEAGVGYGPKMFARIFRMRSALKLIRASDPDGLDLAAIAFATGYADQAHMTRELAALAGAPPTRLPELSR